MSIDYATVAATWIGRVGLFLGVETINWTVDDFKAAAQGAKGYGVDSLYVKVADGSNEWNGGIGNFKAIHDAVNAAGVGAVPYIYSYGDKFGGLDAEISIIETLMRSYGGCIVDMEVEWNGQVEWAARMEAALRPVPGLLFVSTWGDPVQQDWISVINTLAPCVNAWMPQYYSDYLVSCYDQYGSLIQFPTLDAAAEFGPNNVLANVEALLSRGVKSLSFWEYATVKSEIAALQQAIKQLKQGAPTPTPTPIPTPPRNTYMDKAMADCWNSSPVRGLNYDSGIAGSWKDEYRAGRYRGPALTPEYHSVDYAGNAIIVQEFPGGRCEHSVKTGANVWINRP